MDYGFWAPRKEFNSEYETKTIEECVGRDNLTASAFYPSIVPYYTSLEDAIKDMFFQGDISFNDEVVITNIRHKTSLQEAFDSLNLVVRSIEDHMPEDFYSIDLMSAYTSLGNVIGESVEDDLVQEIFSKFCMGK